MSVYPSLVPLTIVSPIALGIAFALGRGQETALMDHFCGGSELGLLSQDGEESLQLGRVIRSLLRYSGGGHGFEHLKAQDKMGERKRKKKKQGR